MPSAVSDLCALRDSIARLETSDPAMARAPRPDSVVPLGRGSLGLDAVLGGGMKRGTLHEIVAASARDEAAAAAFTLAVAVRCSQSEADEVSGQTASTLVWIVDDRAAQETGTPYRPGLAAHGIAADRLVLVRTRDTATTLWATEEALRAGARVVLTELWRARSYDLATSRRLLLAARRTGATNLLVHVGLGAGDTLSSVADTRFAVAAAPGLSIASAGNRTPIPGLPGFAVRLAKLRGPAGVRGFDRDEIHGLVWDRATRCFRPGAARSRLGHPHRTSGVLEGHVA